MLWTWSNHDVSDLVGVVGYDFNRISARNTAMDITESPDSTFYGFQLYVSASSH